MENLNDIAMETVAYARGEHEQHPGLAELDHDQKNAAELGARRALAFFQSKGKPTVPPDRERELIEAGNRYLEEARSARRALADYRVARDFDLTTHLDRQREFSARTFGPGARTKGVIDHIRKELSEIEADPADIEEWVDVILLAFDGAWRAGWRSEAIVAAIAAKQAKNEARNWPDWRTADPDRAIEHDRRSDGGANIVTRHSAIAGQEDEGHV